MTYFIQRYNPEIERGLLTLWPFVAYMLAEGLQLSGVVSILFAGITMAHYTVHNLSPPARKYSSQLFKVLSSIAEGLVFVYIGLACPAVFYRSRLLAEHWMLLPVTLVACLLCRALNVQACTSIVNRFRQGTSTLIDEKMKFILWFGGLRGGVSFALAASARVALSDTESSELFEVCTLFIVIVTLVICGGTVGPLTRQMDLSAKQDLGNGESVSDFATWNTEMEERPSAKYGLYEDGWIPSRYETLSVEVENNRQSRPYARSVRAQVRKNLTKQFFLEHRWPRLHRKSTYSKLKETVPNDCRTVFSIIQDKLGILLRSCSTSLLYFVEYCRGDRNTRRNATSFSQSRYRKLDVIVEEPDEEEDDEDQSFLRPYRDEADEDDSQAVSVGNSANSYGEHRTNDEPTSGGFSSASALVNQPNIRTWENFDEAVLKRWFVTSQPDAPDTVDTDTANQTVQAGDGHKQEVDRESASD